MTRTRGPKPTDKKKLNNPTDFFLACVLVLGAPEKRATSYLAPNNYGSGIAAFVRYHPQGVKFTEFLALQGEAKSRASYWYRLWLRWFEVQQRRTVACGDIQERGTVR